MDSHKISGVPIVNSDGRLVGQITVKCIHLLNSRNRLDSLETPLRLFLGLADQADALTVTRSTHLEVAIQKFRENFTHRLYLVDEAGKVSGVCSFKDVIKMMMG